MADIRINRDLCNGCGDCIEACPFGAIRLDSDNRAEILENCTICCSCVEACPQKAIIIEADPVVKTVNLDDYSGIWVFAEHKDGRLRQVVFELLGEARKLAEDHHIPRVTAFLVGGDAEKFAPILIGYGADRVLSVPLIAEQDGNEEAICAAAAPVISKYHPEIILIGATAFGRSCAPRLASRLKTGLTADCTALEIDKEKDLLRQTRPAFGGNLMATIICPNHRPQMATVRPHVFKPALFDGKRKGEVLTERFTPLQHLAIRLLKTIKNPEGEINISDAEIIVTAGKGMCGAKNIPLVEELASLLGGAVGSTRPLVDAGIMPYNRQIGQTGKTVGPKLYIACGVSGAIQHQAGMSSADTIIAINNAPDAPIFSIAHYGIVADAPEALRELIVLLKANHNTAKTN